MYKYPPRRERRVSSLYDMLDKSAHDYPDKAAFLYMRNGEDRELSYSALKLVTEATRAAFSRLGLTGARVAVIGEKCVEWISTYFAAVNGNGVIVPFDRELKAEQIRDFTVFAECECVVYSKGYANIFDGFYDALPIVKYFIEIDTSVELVTEYAGECADITASKKLSFDALLRYGFSMLKNGTASLPPQPDLEKMCALLFTSGTTGSAKGVMLCQRNFVYNLNENYQIVDIWPEDVFVSVLPIHHTYEMTAGIMSPLFMGCTICLNDSTKYALRDFKKYRPTMLCLVPVFVNTIYKKMLDTIEKKGMTKKFQSAIKISNLLLKIGIDKRKAFFGEILEAMGGRLRIIISGGAPLNPEMVGCFEAMGVSMKQGYGITECAPIIGIVPKNRVNPRAAGMPLAGMQCRIEKESPDDETGEIVVRGENVMLGYYKNQAATDAVLSRGWFYTGDCGYIDDDGFIYITGRKKNVIVLNNGKNVFPEEIEEYLENVPMLKECAVVGREGEDGTIGITALIFPDYEKTAEAGLTDDEKLQAYFKEEITKINRGVAAFKQIRSIEIRKTPFPKNTSQKIQRFKIDKE